MKPLFFSISVSNSSTLSQEVPCRGLATGDRCCAEVYLGATESSHIPDSAFSLNLPKRFACSHHLLYTLHYLLQLKYDEFSIPNLLTVDHFILYERLS
jgi:hypothetical protein